VYDKFIDRREFQKGELVLLFNSRLKPFIGKLRSQWLGPFKVLKVHPYSAIEIGINATDSINVNDSRLKHYIAGEPIEMKVSYDLSDVPSA